MRAIAAGFAPGHARCPLLHCHIMLPGYATPEGTSRYAQRFAELREAGHFRQHHQVPGPGELWLSSIGLGTYLGEPDEVADRGYEAAISAALVGGVNVLDAAINYRHQRSERNIGAVLARLISASQLARDEVLICSKAGYLSFDGRIPADARGYFVREYMDKSIIRPGELAGGMHCMAPNFLSDQLERSRRNLGLETIDVYYLHNPESQLPDVTQDEFYARLRSAFGFFEQAVKQSRIRWYGVATWNGFRLPPGQQGGLSLQKVLQAARDAGGDAHHLRFVQMPFNLAMPEAFVLKNQLVDGEAYSTLELAWKGGVAAVGSASLYQSQLTRGLPHWIGERLGTDSDCASAIQFSRSAPGLASALVGMGRPEHVQANLELARVKPATEEEWIQLFQRT